MTRPGLERIGAQIRETDGENTLKRTLEGPQLVALGIGAIMGAGIFVATGIVAGNHAGPATILSFLLAATGCLCAGLCYAEFAAMAPVSGSAYSYVRATFGQTSAWIIGWCLILEYLMAAATVAVGWSGYLATLLDTFGMALPTTFLSAPFAVGANGHLVVTGALVNAPAVFLLIGLTALLTAGVRLSVRVNAALVLLKLCAVFLFISFGAFYVNTDHWKPFLPENTGEFGEYGWSGVLRGAGIIFYAYLGFDTVSTAARETRNPQRNMPLGIIGSLVICTAVYIAFALVLTGLAPYRMLSVPNPVSVALDYAGPELHPLKTVVELGAVVGLTSVILALLYGQSRVLYSMSRDRLIPAALGKVNVRGSPYVSVSTVGALAALASGLLPIEVLGELISIGTLAAFIFVCAGVFYLRIARPDLPRPFRTPAAPFVCSTGILLCMYMMTSLPGATWQRFAGWMALGLAIYYFYGRRRSKTPTLTETS